MANKWRVVTYDVSDRRDGRPVCELVREDA